jgi:large-conductance mechanosensitive channel
MMDAWVPLALGTIKFIVLGTCCFFAIKSHRDGARKEKAEEKEREKKMKGLQ